LNSKLLLVGDVLYSRAPWDALPLPETAKELEVVESQSGLAREDIVLLMGKNAVPSTVRATLPDVRIAHFATHGMLADSVSGAELGLEQRFFGEMNLIGERVTHTGRNPLSLCGIVLARESDGNSILSGESIVQLPLTGLELVVLSGCATAQGDIVTGEGVYGLQRAFSLAGTRAVIASQWEVNSRETRKLMSRFNENLWSRNMGAADALRSAQLEMITTGTGQSREPYYWAAWSLEGAPGVQSEQLVSGRSETADDVPKVPTVAEAGWTRAEVVVVIVLIVLLFVLTILMWPRGLKKLTK
jgi:CHAT domain-containing protein